MYRKFSCTRALYTFNTNMKRVSKYYTIRRWSVLNMMNNILLIFLFLQIVGKMCGVQTYGSTAWTSDPLVIVTTTLSAGITKHLYSWTCRKHENQRTTAWVLWGGGGRVLHVLYDMMHVYECRCYVCLCIVMFPCVILRVFRLTKCYIRTVLKSLCKTYYLERVPFFRDKSDTWFHISDIYDVCTVHMAGSIVFTMIPNIDKSNLDRQYQWNTHDVNLITYGIDAIVNLVDQNMIGMKICLYCILIYTVSFLYSINGICDIIPIGQYGRYLTGKAQDVSSQYFTPTYAHRYMQLLQKGTLMQQLMITCICTAYSNFVVRLVKCSFLLYVLICVFRFNGYGVSSDMLELVRGFICSFKTCRWCVFLCIFGIKWGNMTNESELSRKYQTKTCRVQKT